jgi:hypothetical protein
MLALADLVPDCWLEVCLHPGGLATGQLYPSFPWFSLVPEQMLTWYPNSTLHCMLPMQPPPPVVTFQISPYTNVTLTFDLDFGLDHPVHGGYG